MSHQVCDRVFQLLLTGAVIGESLAMKCRQQIVPYGIQFPLHVAGVGSDGYCHVLIGNHDDELTGGAIPTKRIVPAPPELKAIPLFPVRSYFCVTLIPVRYLLGCRLLDPVPGDQLLVIPFSFFKTCGLSAASGFHHPWAMT